MKKKLILKGIGASVGKAFGKVKIILNKKEFNKMEDGCILVTTMTNPFFVPLMHKVKGIITDVGGLLCHAAIVSRELGIPCIVGTRKATKVLKDNMKVEIDGKNGKVYLIQE